MFKLTREEILRISQIVTSSGNPRSRTLKFSKSVMVFTEHGVSMLSSVLNSPMAIQVNIQIMRTFAKLREILSTNKDLAAKLKELDGKIGKHDEEIRLIFKAIRQLMVPPERKKPKIGFKREKG